VAVDKRDLTTFAKGEQAAKDFAIRDALTYAEALIYDPTSSDDEVEEALAALEELSPEWAAATRLSAGEWRNPKHQP